MLHCLQMTIHYFLLVKKKKEREKKIIVSLIKSKVCCL